VSIKGIRGVETMPHTRRRNPDAITFRPVGKGDEGFLFRVFEDTRVHERQAVESTGNEWDTFIRMQFEAQRRHHEAAYQNAEHSIILSNGEPVGRMWVWESEDQMRLLDIAILSEHRSCGIGTHMIRSLQARASSSGKPLRHMVELNNPDALRLYQRLGFTVFEQQGLHWHLEWRSPDSD